jgi:hypothetical protein
MPGSDHPVQGAVQMTEAHDVYVAETITLTERILSASLQRQAQAAGTG